MVALQILALSVRVRVLLSQQTAALVGAIRRRTGTSARLSEKVEAVKVPTGVKAKVAYP